MKAFDISILHFIIINTKQITIDDQFSMSILMFKVSYCLVFIILASRVSVKIVE